MAQNSKQSQCTVVD